MAKKMVRAKKVEHCISYAEVSIDTEGRPVIKEDCIIGEGFMSDKGAETALRKAGVTGMVTSVVNTGHTYAMPSDEFFSLAKPVVDEVAAPSETPTIL
jgi:hypothetical protein